MILTSHPSVLNLYTMALIYQTSVGTSADSVLKIWAAQYIENLLSLQYQHAWYTFSRELLELQ